MSGSSETLRRWASKGALAQVVLSADGMQLSWNGETISGTNADKVQIHLNGKSCEYTLASIFLQIINPNQSLVTYRKACKQHQVKDPVKPLEKPTIIGYFLGSSASAPSQPPAAEPNQEARPPKPSSKPSSSSDPARRSDSKSRSSSDKHHHRGRDQDRDRERSRSHHKHDKRHHKKDKHRDGKRRHTSSSGRGDDAPSSGKKKHKTIDNAKLMTNLSTVVDKRAQASTKDGVSEAQRKDREKLHASLSCEGFGVTPDMLQQHREKTTQMMAWEIPVGNSASILQAAPGKDLTRILQMYLETINPPPKRKGGSSRSSHGRGGDDSGRSGFRQHLVGKKPIIVLPKGMTAPLTIINAHEFFGKRRFVPRDVMLKQGGRNKGNLVTSFQRKVNARLGGGTLEYELIDNPKQRLKSSKDWDRVVAVVALGASWQFKDWPGIYSNPVHLFGRAFGFYVGMEGTKIPKDLAAWAVTRCVLSRDKRGLDSVSYASFWNGVDEFMSIHKPEMLPQDGP